MADTCDRCGIPFATEPRAAEGCSAHLPGGDWQACLLRVKSAEVVELTAELAEASKPIWHGRTLVMLREVAVAVVYVTVGGDWAYSRHERGYDAIGGRGYSTEAEAMAAAEAALGVKP